MQTILDIALYGHFFVQTFAHCPYTLYAIGPSVSNYFSLNRFHYCQAVRRKCLKSTKHFFRKLNEYGGADVYKMFHALPLLPQNKIDDGLAFIKSKVVHPKLRKLLYPIFKYFDGWWMRSVNNWTFNIVLFLNNLNKTIRRL